MRRIALLVFVVFFFAAAVFPAAPQPAAPKLAVIIVVDQMRADYVDRFRGDWTAGLKRLVANGAWFRNAAYPYLNTVTCAGHATIATGAFPHVHGIVQNVWYDRSAGSLVSCTADSAVRAIRYDDKTINTGDSASQLLVPTFADEMRRTRSAHVVTLSLKDRSAIMLAGHGADAVTWLSNTLDGWQTSSAFATKTVAPVHQFLEMNPIDADYAKTWTRLLPEARYHESDDGVAEAPPKGWTPTFPHPLISASGKPDLDFHSRWERSPFADAYLGRFAEALVQSMALGHHDGTDVLGISFSSPDLVGHSFGPASQETHDMYVQLDRTIGTLLDRLDALVGRDRYVVALSADHGVTALPEQLAKSGRDGGRMDSAAMTAALERTVTDLLGPGRYVASWFGNDVYFMPGVYERLARMPGALNRVVTDIAGMPGIARALRSEELRDPSKTTDPVQRAAALSYVTGRSGDIIVAPKPGWMFAAAGTTHGSSNADDQRVPVLFMGYGIKRGEYSQPASPADIAPTLAAICGIELAHAEGHALGAALTRR